MHGVYCARRAKAEVWERDSTDLISFSDRFSIHEKLRKQSTYVPAKVWRSTVDGVVGDAPVAV